MSLYDRTWRSKVSKVPILLGAALSGHPLDVQRPSRLRDGELKRACRQIGSFCWHGASQKALINIKLDFAFSF